MSDTPGRWADLRVRLASGAVMTAVGLVAVWIGGWPFLALVAAICGVMIWELVQLLKAGSRMALPLGAISAAIIVGSGLLPVGWMLPFLLAPAMIAFGQLEHNRTVFSVFSVMIMVAGYGLLALRSELGFAWMLWLVLIVIVTDVGGYFAGRFIGGPRFWPRVSPKKTWSGTVAGWIGAALVGVIWIALDGLPAQIIGVSVAVAMASQIGDIAESAVKRRMQAKDSSNLLPGHGGVLDRFDGMLGASVFFLLVARLIDFPPAIL